MNVPLFQRTGNQLAVVLVGLAVLAGAQAPAPDPAATLAQGRDAALKALDEREAAEREKLAASYRAAVERSRGEAQTRGDLDAVVAWKAELTRLDQWPVIQAAATPSPHPGVLAFQQRLAGMLATREASYLPAKRAILEKYAGALDAHIKELVRGDRIDQALRLRTRLEEARAELAAVPAAPPPAAAPSAPPPGAPAAPLPAPTAPAAGMPRLLLELEPDAKPGPSIPGAADSFAGRWNPSGRVLLAQTHAGPAVVLAERGASLEIPAQDGLRSAARSFTFAYWVYLMSAHRSAHLSLGKEDEEERMRIGNMGLNKIRFEVGADVLEGDATWRLWAWNHVVCVKDSAGQQLLAFVNGQPAGARPGSKANLHNLQHKTLYLGRPAGAPPPGLWGMVARARVYEGVASAPQVTALFGQDRKLLDDARARLRRQPTNTPEQLTAALGQRLLTFSNRERPRHSDEDALLLLRANGTVSGPWEADWKAISKDTVDVFSGVNHHELKLEVSADGDRSFEGEYKGPAIEQYGRRRSGFVLE